MAPRTALCLALATLALGLFGLERAFGWYAPRHFIPESRMREAVARGPHCTVFAGDSRMVAGFDEKALAGALHAQGREGCLATVAIGALPIQGITVAVREYLRRGGKPDVLVLGAAEETLLRRTEALDPGTFIGNESILLGWSEPSDRAALYPGFPFRNVRAFDQGFRFTLARASALGSFISLAWLRVQAAQDRLTGKQRAPANAFGAVADMEASGRHMMDGALERLRLAFARPEAERLDPAFTTLETLVRDAGSKLVVVELPMPADYRRSVTDAPEGKRYREWFRAYLAARGHRFVDLTHPDWLTPDDFADFLHLNAQGAAAFSRELGGELARTEPALPR